MYYYFNEDLASKEAERGRYRYVWSMADRAFVRYTSYLMDIHESGADHGKLIVSQPQERLPITKLLSVPMVFISPTASCEWVRSVTKNVPATYGGMPIILGGYETHRQPNGLIIDVSAHTFAWDVAESTPFGPREDGVILRVLDSNGEPIYPPSIFEPGERSLVADSPRQASMIIKHILALQL